MARSRWRGTQPSADACSVWTGEREPDLLARHTCGWMIEVISVSIVQHASLSVEFGEEPEEDTSTAKASLAKITGLTTRTSSWTLGWHQIKPHRDDWILVHEIFLALEFWS